VGDLKAEIKKNAKVEINEKYFAKFKDATPPQETPPIPGGEPME
jgi:hypothetical protein